MVSRGPLAYFSTTTGDAWVLDPEDGFALCLAKDGQAQPFRIMEMDSTYAIEWNAHYRIERNLFIVTDRSGRTRSILGYPTNEIERAIQSIRP